LGPIGGGDYYVILWNWQNGTSSILSKLSDAHDTPDFGPIIEWVNENNSLYGALVVRDNILSDLDRWILVLVSLPSGATQELEIDPILLGKTTSAAALGF